MYWMIFGLAGAVLTYLVTRPPAELHENFLAGAVVTLTPGHWYAVTVTARPPMTLDGLLSSVVLMGFIGAKMSSTQTTADGNLRGTFIGPFMSTSKAFTNTAELGIEEVKPPPGAAAATTPNA